MNASRLGRALARVPVAGLAIPLLVTLTLWWPNTHRVAHEDALPTAAAVLALATVALIGLRLLFGSWRRATLALAIWGGYVLYAPLALAKVTPSLWLQSAGLLVGALFAWDVSRRIPKNERDLTRLNGAANLLIVAPTLIFAGMTLVRQVDLERQRPEVSALFPAFGGDASRSGPDVWHIIFDRYAGRDTLGRVYAYDNRPFLDALRARGFSISDPAYSNYQRTGHSVASTLNGNYLDRFTSLVGVPSSDWVPLYRSMTDNAALGFFKRGGYETIFAGSWWNPTRRSAAADRNINYRALPELGRLLLDQSLAGFLMRRMSLPYGDGLLDQCRRVQEKFRRLELLAAEPERKYVFAHFLLPHPPYVINASGQCRSREEALRSSRRDNYVDQLAYTNRATLKLIDAILSARRPAVILVHSDEGPWPAPFIGDETALGRDPVLVDWTTLPPHKLREKMEILLAMRFADGQSRPLPNSPVNLYPVILQTYFEGTGKLLPDRNFVYKRQRELYRFEDVTGKLRER